MKIPYKKFVARELEISPELKAVLDAFKNVRTVFTKEAGDRCWRDNLKGDSWYGSVHFNPESGHWNFGCNTSYMGDQILDEDPSLHTSFYNRNYYDPKKDLTTPQKMKVTKFLFNLENAEIIE